MLILYCGNDMNTTERYLKALRGLPVLTVGDEDLGCSAVQLRERIEDRVPRQGSGRAFLFVDEEMDRDEVNKLLLSLHGAGIERPLMAVRTAHNENWPFSELAKELAKEDEYFRGREELSDLVRSFTKEEMQDPYVSKSAITAFLLLQKPELSEEDLQSALKALRQIRAILDGEQADEQN